MIEEFDSMDETRTTNKEKLSKLIIVKLYHPVIEKVKSNLQDRESCHTND